MSLSRLFLWIYQLPPIRLVWILLVFTLAFLRLYHLLRDRPWRRPALIVLLLLWAGVTLWATVLNRSLGTEASLQLLPFHSYLAYLDTGNRELLRSAVMNVALFYPAGLLFAAVMPRAWRIGRRLAVAAAVFCLFSLLIEWTQYCFMLGQTEVDDVIHNTLGAFLGCLAFCQNT